MEFVHRSVLASEVMANLPLPTEGGLLIDCTLGEGGHSALFLERYPNLQVIGIDRDATILSKAVKRLENMGHASPQSICGLTTIWRVTKGRELTLSFLT